MLIVNVNQFLHTLDEILFANVDVSSAVLNTLFTHLATGLTFQQSLHEEFRPQKSQITFNLSKYLSQTDSLLNFAVMESMRMSPAFGK